jgi:hypothetical protein
MATVYDKSSLFLAPSGVNDGTVFVQKPVPIYGSEQVTNGDFSTDSDWTKGTGWSIANGKATFENSGGADDLTQTCLESGKTYLLTFDTLEVNSGNFAYAIGGSYTFINNIEANKTHRVIAAAGSTVLKLRGTSSFNGSIDNVSIKEVLVDGADFDFTRGSNLSATRVNEAQLIEKGRENLLLQSNQLDTTWTTNSASITGGQAGYDGSNNAWKSTNINPYGRIIQNVTSSGVNTFSIYAKAGNSPYFRIQFQSVGSDAFFDLSDGSVIKTEATIINAGTESVGNGWYRVFASVNEAITDVRVVHTGAGGIGGGSIGGYFYIQDAQLEQGLVATSLITTGASTVQAGLLENTPRLDYSGGATCPSLLLEPIRANSLIQSEYLRDSSTWSQLETIVTQNEAISPEGLQNASKLLCVSGFANHQIDAMNVSISSGAVTGSVYAKKGANADWLRLRLSGTSNPPRAWFDLQNGVVGSVDVTGTASIEDVGNGWYRCSLTEAGNTASGGGGRLQIFINKIDGQTQFTSNGDEYHYIYGAQMEQGAYPTSYIPTYGTSQTRAADDTGTLDLSLIGLDGQDVTHFIEFKNNQSIIRDNGSTSFRFSSDTANFGSFRIYRSASTAKQLTVVFQDTNGGFSNPGGYEMTSLNPKVAIKRVWATGEIKVFVDGNKVIEASSTLFNSWNKVDMEGTGSTIEVKQLVSFPTVLSDLDCEILTGATTYETFEEMALALNYTVYE